MSNTDDWYQTLDFNLQSKKILVLESRSLNITAFTTLFKDYHVHYAKNIVDFYKYLERNKYSSIFLNDTLDADTCQLGDTIVPNDGLFASYCITSLETDKEISIFLYGKSAEHAFQMKSDLLNSGFENVHITSLAKILKEESMP